MKIPKIRIIDTDARRVTIWLGKRYVVCRDTGGIRPKYLARKYVIKFNCCLDQSSSEIKRYKRIRQSDRKYFPKMLVMNPKEGYLVQERIQFKKHVTDKEDEEAIRIVRRLIKRYRIGDVEACDRGYNWNIRADGRPVIYDFGV